MNENLISIYENVNYFDVFNEYQEYLIYYGYNLFNIDGEKKKYLKIINYLFQSFQMGNH